MKIWGVFSYIIKSSTFATTGQTLGFASPPSQNTNVNFLMVTISTLFDNSYPVFIHEMGHIFDLPHTHLGNGEELVNGSNCATAGDGFCDTPADSQASGCNKNYNRSTCIYEGNCTDDNSVTIMPDVTNYMGYYYDCASHFSSEQLMRMEFVADNEPSRTILINGTCNADPIAYDKVEFEDSSEGVETELNAGVTTVFFPVNSNNQRLSNILSTNQNGNFQFVHKSNEDRFALIAANVKRYDNDMLDGVSTFDLVKIRNHILNFEMFTSGYQYIAADANNSGSVTTFDMVKIRNVILNNEQKFGDFNYPYRLIPEYIPIDYAAEFNINPFGMSQVNYPDYMISESGMPTNPNDSDKQVPIGLNKVGFEAIKIGDVNSTNSHSPFALEAIESRSPISISLGEFDCVRRGETKWIYAIGIPNKKITAYQLGLEYDMDKIEVLEFKSDTYNEEDDFWGINTTDIEIGELKTLWLDNLARERDFQGERWIALKIKAKTLSDVKRVFSLNTNTLETKFWTEEGDGVGGEIILTTKPSDNIDGTENQINSVIIYPNPTSTEVLINISVERNKVGTVIIRDQLGNMIEKEIQFYQGENQISLDLSDLNKGVIFYNIFLSEEQSYNGKFIRM